MCHVSAMAMMFLLALALPAGALLSWYAREEPLRLGVAAVGDAPSAQSSAKRSGGGEPRRFTAMMLKPAASPRKVCNDTHTWNLCVCT